MKRRWLGRDFHKKSLHNPFGRIERRNINNPTRKRIGRFLLLMSFGGWIYFLFYSPFFNIENIIINDLKKLNAISVRGLVENEIAGRRFAIFPKINLFSFSEKHFIEEFNKQFFVETIIIETIWPHTLMISIKEKEAAALVLTNTDDLFIDNEARIFRMSTHEELATSTSFSDHVARHAESSLLLIQNTDLASAEIRKNIFAERVLQAIFSVVDVIKKRTNVQLRFVSFKGGDIPKITVVSTDGFEMYFDLDDPAKQVEKLIIFLQAKPPEDRKNLRYIDLRFGDKVYVK